MRLPMINIADYPPTVGSDDWWPSYQKAVDTIRTSGKPGVIYTPGRKNPYLISKPILADADYLSFVGDGADVSVIQVKGECYSDAIQFGVGRTSIKNLGDLSIPQTLTPFSEYWIDSTLSPDGQQPYLDATADQRYGLRTRGIAYAYFQGTPFDMGPLGTVNWSETRQLTIDFVIYNPAGWYGGDQGIRLFGAGSPDAPKPSPFYCGVGGSSATISFDYAVSDGVHRRATFNLPAPSTPMQRISIQMDLTQPSVLAFVNRKQVAVTLASAGSAPKLNMSLLANEYRQFQLGTCLVDAAFNPGNITDQIIFGFKLTGAALYLDTGADGTQARIDNPGIPLNDLQQFFAPELSSFYALLPLRDAGNDWRCIPWESSQPGGAWFGVGSGLFLHDSSLGVSDTRIGNAVRDLTLAPATVSGPAGYGRALCHGPIYEFRAQDCRFTGGAHNFGALNGAVGYPLKVRDCEFTYGGDAAIYAQGNMWWGQRLTIKYWGREAIRALNSFLDLRQVFYAPGGPGDCVLKFHNASGAILDDHIIDFEGGGPALAYVWCEAGVNVGPTFLTLRNVTFGTQAKGSFYIVLKGNDTVTQSQGLATLILENCTPSTGYVIAQPIPGVWAVKQC
jgi:hypothetical protein